jgi:hypothetical protein
MDEARLMSAITMDYKVAFGDHDQTGGGAPWAAPNLAVEHLIAPAQVLLPIGIRIRDEYNPFVFNFAAYRIFSVDGSLVAPGEIVTEVEDGQVLKGRIVSVELGEY